MCVYVCNLFVRVFIGAHDGISFRIRGQLIFPGSRVVGGHCASPHRFICVSCICAVLLIAADRQSAARPYNTTAHLISLSVLCFPSTELAWCGNIWCIDRESESRHGGHYHAVDVPTGHRRRSRRAQRLSHSAVQPSSTRKSRVAELPFAVADCSCSSNWPAGSSRFQPPRSSIRTRSNS